MEYLTFALPKGKLYGPTVRLLEAAGLGSSELGDEDSRKLLFVDEEKKLRYIATRPSDVPTYVEHGAADLGIVGKDVLLEDEKKVYELLDLGYGGCRFALAAPEELAARGLNGRAGLRVATKFPHVAERYFMDKGKPVEIIVLHGAVELAPIAGLADAIVDIVSTGRTLQENRLVPVETIAESTARMIANPVSLRLKRDRIDPVTQDLRREAARLAGEL